MQKTQEHGKSIPAKHSFLYVKLDIWILQHIQAFIFSLGQLCRNPIASFLTISVIGISLALPAGFHIILNNARLLTAGWEGTVQITAFLKMEVDNDTAGELARQIEQFDGIDKVKLITREQALEEYRQLSGFGNAFNALEGNPLPSLLLIKPHLSGLPEKSTEELLNNLRNIPEIDNAQYDQQWIKRLNAIIQIVQRIVIILAVFLGLAVLLIIGNTIRMLIYNRRSEIEIAKLFGATNGFIRRPFLYSGFWYGLSGGIIAWLLINLILLILKDPADQLARLYNSDFTLAGLSMNESMILLAAGILLGLIGSFISVQRHFRAIEPV
jgi:cell division transport system permease protein